MRNLRLHRRCCDEYLRVDVRKLNFGDEAPIWQYPSNLAVSLRESHARFVHRMLDYRVEIDWTPCNYGGARPWFRCPPCGTRRAVLYTPPAGDEPVACRGCLRLLHASECEDQLGRALLKEAKCQARLDAYIAKPKWRHWETCERLTHERELSWVAVLRAAKFPLTSPNRPDI